MATRSKSANIRFDSRQGVMSTVATGGGCGQWCSQDFYFETETRQDISKKNSRLRRGESVSRTS